MLAVGSPVGTDRRRLESASLPRGLSSRAAERHPPNFDSNLCSSVSFPEDLKSAYNAAHNSGPICSGNPHPRYSPLAECVVLRRLRDPAHGAPRDLFAPALARAGLHPDRVICAETWRDAEVLPVMEEGVRCPGLAGVVGEIGRWAG